MMNRVRGALLATAMVGGGVLGATGMTGVALAHESDGADAQTAVAVQTDDGEQAPDEGRPEGEGRVKRGGCHLEAAAEALGMSEDELRSQLESGSTIAQVAEANDVSVDDVVAAMVAEAQEHLDEKVAEGELTQEEANERLAEKQERIEERVNSPFEPRQRGERPDQSGESESNESTESTESS